MVALTRRNALAALAGTGAFGIAATLPHCASVAALAAEADPMINAITEHRAWLEAYSTAPFDGRAEEEVWLGANPDDAGDRLHQMPPMPTTKAGAVAAIRFVMEDRDYIQASHARILKQALAYLEGSAV